MSLAILRDAGPHAFGFVRVWGTVGYFVLIVSFPWILESYQAARGIGTGDGGSPEPGLGIMFIVTAALQRYPRSSASVCRGKVWSPSAPAAAIGACSWAIKPTFDF